MLEYLVTSKTRRVLLNLLWGEEREGTMAQFAKWADVAFAGAYKELHAMEEAGLVTSEWKGGSQQFSRARNHPMGRALKTLLNSEKAPSKEMISSKHSKVVKEELAYLGLPVNASKKKPSRNRKLESLVAYGCKLAKEDASVARAFPVFLHENWKDLDFKSLEAECKDLGEKHAMGFFLALTSQLSGNEEMEAWSELFRDHRRTKSNYFFVKPTKHSKQLAEFRTPEVAKNWNLLMNMSMDSFTSTFDKFNHAAAHAR